MILKPKRYNPETLIRRIEKSPIFGFPFRSWILETKKREVKVFSPYITGPYRRLANPTNAWWCENYTGKVLRTSIDLIALADDSPETPLENKTPLTEEEAQEQLIELLGEPSKSRQDMFDGVFRYDFWDSWRKTHLPQIYDLRVYTQEYAESFLEGVREGKESIEMDRLPKNIRQRVLRTDEGVGYSFRPA